MIFIPNNTPSSKNSKVATSKGVFHSKTVTKYLRSLGIQHYSASKKEVTFYKTKPCWFPYEELSNLFKGVEYPIEVGIHFVRNSKTNFDFHNACQIIFDLLVAFKIIPDDSMNYVIPRAFEIEDKWYSISKDKPGVYITIIK
jgi:hypothetical protein